MSSDSETTSTSQSQADTAEASTQNHEADRKSIRLPVPSDAEVGVDSQPPVRPRSAKSLGSNSNNSNKTAPPTPTPTPTKTPSPLVEKLRLLDCLEALKFDSAIEKSREQSESQLMTDNNSKNSKSSSGIGARVKPSTSSKSRSRVTPEQTFENTGAWLSSQPDVQKESQKPENNEPGYAAVIKQWGKRPLLVESEAPWTRRNKMYLNAVKALEKAKQKAAAAATANANNNRATSGQQQQQPTPVSAMATQGMMMFPPGVNMYPNQGQSPAGNTNLIIPQANIYSPTGPNNNAPIVSSISPLPPDLNINPNRPLQVAVESPYPYQEIVLPVQAPVQTVMYGHLNSQGLWMPLLQQLHQFQHQQQLIQSQMQNQQHQQQLQQQYNTQHLPPLPQPRPNSSPYNNYKEVDSSDDS